MNDPSPDQSRMGNSNAELRPARDTASGPTNQTDQTLIPVPSADGMARPGAPPTNGAAPPTSASASAPAPATRAPQVPAVPGMPVVPGYVVLRKVARGGMGTVFVAHDPAFEREVAIKVMHHGQDADRFVVESKVTAQLPHPGVPPVYALGTLGDERPFLAMKLIEGRTLSDELKASGPADRPRLVGAFEQICHTVGYAHARGIVHRDLKPANVMVGAFGEVLVMDWGLAKHVGGENDRAAAPPAGGSGPTEHTLAGQVKGTPAYMAPEQARGEPVDARADVFALGGILVALLTGRAPFGGTTVMDTIQSAASANLTDAFARLDASGADPELVAVAKRCLAPSAADRYDNGEAVAAAVSAYRAGVEDRLRTAERDRAAAQARAAEEVNTRREAEARAAEQRKRRKAQLLLAASVVLLAAGAGAFAWHSDRARERAGRERAEFEAVQARDGAELKAVAAVAAERERGAAERARQGFESNLRLAAELRAQYKFKAADAALAQATELAKGAPDLLPRADAARRDLALVVRLDEIRYRKWLRTAEVKDDKGEAAKKTAPPAYKAALAAAGLDLAALDPTEAARRVAASPVAAELVAALDDWAVYEPDAGLRDRLLAVAKAADPGTWTDRLRDPAVRSSLLGVNQLAADAAGAAPRPAAVVALAELMHRTGLDPSELLTAARVRHPSDFELAFVLAEWDADDKRHADALARYEAARAIRAENAVVWNNLGAVLLLKGDVAFAHAALKRSIELDDKYSHAHSNYGATLYLRGDKDAALASFKRAVELDPNTPAAHNNIGKVLADRNDRVGAVAAFETALKYDPDHLNAHMGLANLRADAGDHKAAITGFKRVLEIDPGYAPAYNNMGNAHANSGDPGAAARAYQKAIELDKNYALPWHGLGMLREREKDYDGAGTAFERALAIDPKHTGALIELGSLRRRQGKKDEAVKLLRRAVEIDPKDAVGHYNLGIALRATGDDKGAVAAYREAIKHRPRFFEAHTNLSGALTDLGDFDGAVASAREAMKIDPKDSRPHNNAGIALIHKRDFDGAVAAFREAVRLDPKNESARDNLELALKERAEFERTAPPPREKK